MSFGPHFLKLARLPGVQARVAFGEPLAGGSDRKALARDLQVRVAAAFVPVRQGTLPAPQLPKKDASNLPGL
jgi:hypothetical protein